MIELCREQGINYSIYDNYRLPGNWGSGIPKVFVFDHTGKMIYDGRGGSEIDAIVERALAAAPDVLLGENNYKELKSEAGSILKRSNLGKTLARLREITGGDDEASDAEKEEADRMIQRLLPYAERQWKEAEAAIEDAPSKALDQLKLLAKVWKGDQIGDMADERYKELKKDDDFKAEVKADEMLQKILEASSGGNDLTVLKQAASALKKIVDKYPDTKAGKKAEQLLNKVM